MHLVSWLLFDAFCEFSHPVCNKLKSTTEACWRRLLTIRQTYSWKENDHWGSHEIHSQFTPKGCLNINSHRAKILSPKTQATTCYSPLSAVSCVLLSPFLSPKQSGLYFSSAPHKQNKGREHPSLPTTELFLIADAKIPYPSTGEDEALRPVESSLFSDVDGWSQKSG